MKLPGQMKVFFGVLAFAVLFIFTITYCNAFDSFSVTRCLETMPSYHVQLTNLKLETRIIIHSLSG